MVQLPSLFYAEQAPVAVTAPELLCFNDKLFEEFLPSPNHSDAGQQFSLDRNSAAKILGGNRVSDSARPLASAYAGHQFGGWQPLLGDGRAVILGEIETKDGGVFELQLKGSGPTPFSRGGDGRAPLSAVLREYIISEAMAGLSIPTSRSLTVVKTGEKVFRETVEDGAVLARLMPSHIRVGTFQYAAATGDADNVRALADYVLERLFPDIEDGEARYLDMLKAIVERQASLIAKWMQVGFIHGVMNSDNMTVSGETIDYGPCAFIDDFDPRKTYSSIDQFSRYSWNNQPNMAMWNLSRLAESLLPLISDDEGAAIAKVTEVVNGFSELFEGHLYGGFQKKLGLVGEGAAHRPFILETLSLLRDQHVDFTLFFRRLTQISHGDSGVDFSGLFDDPDAAALWLKNWNEKASGGDSHLAAMRSVNPVYIARNHQVEIALNAACANDDFAPFDRLLGAIKNPFDERDGYDDLELPPTPEQEVKETFCGT